MKMVDFNAGSVVASLTVILLATMFGSKMAEAQGGQTKIDAVVDIVFIVSLPMSYSKTGDQKELDAVKKSYIKLAEFFEPGAQKARFAIVQSTTSMRAGTDWTAERIVLNLTVNFDDFKSKMDGWDPRPNSIGNWPESLKDAFDAIDMKILFDDDKTRREGKAVVMIFMKSLYVGTWAENLRKKGVWFYTIAKTPTTGDRDENDQMALARNEAQLLAGVEEKENRFFEYKEQKFTETMLSAIMQKVKIAIVRDLCGWKSMCRYLDNKQEKCDFYLMRDEMANYRLYDMKYCDASKPTGTCSEDDCKRVCDSGWPWEKEPTCGCGKIEGRRKGLPPSTLMYCPTATVCPPCTSAPPVAGAEEMKDVKGKVRDMLLFGGIAAFVFFALVIGIVIGIYFYIKKRNAKDKVADAKMDSMMETMRHISIRVANPGAEAGLAADLTSEKDAKAVPGRSKPGMVKTGSGGAKKTDSIKSGGKSASIKSGSLKK